jgi:hypothetical protein
MFCAVLGIALTAQAFPPAPYNLVYGVVRDRYGTPLTTSSAQVILQSPAGQTATTTIIPGFAPGINYQMKVPMDAGQTPDLYSPNAFLASTAFKMVVVIGGVTNIPIEMVTTNSVLGQPGSTARVDLTLGVDVNGDGLPDAWEYAFMATIGTNVSLSSLNANSILTPDGLTLRQQYILGVYPFDPADPFIITYIGNKTTPAIQFPTITGRTYTVQVSQDMKTWAPVNFAMDGEAPGTTPHSFLYANVIAPVTLYPTSTNTPSFQFYRVKVQ